MSQTLSRAQARRKQVSEREEELKRILKENKRARKESQASPRPSPERLAAFLAVPLDHPQRLRDPEAFRPKGYNLARQLTAFIQHLFVKYPTTLALYRTVLNQEGRALVFDQIGPNEDEMLPLFLAAVQGRSVADLLKGTLNRREAHWFTVAPGHLSIREAQQWARLRAEGFAERECNQALASFGDPVFDPHRAELVRMFAPAWLKGRNLGHLGWVCYDLARMPGGTFRGRTLRSLEHLARDWFRMGRVQCQSQPATWHRALGPQPPIVDGPYWVYPEELLDSHALVEEGTHMRNCVATYAYDCLQADSAIVSLRWRARNRDALGLEVPGAVEKRVTVEVSRREIVQVRARRNAEADERERLVVERWARREDLRICEDAF